MRVRGKEINDRCVSCGELYQCKLFRDGHGIDGERTRIAEMIRCQLNKPPVPKPKKEGDDRLYVGDFE